MQESATERTTIERPWPHCLEVALDFERYPEWARDVKSAEVLERDGEGLGLLVAYRAAAMGRSARYTLRYTYEHDPARITWVLDQGDIVRRLDGQYRFESGADDAGSTEVTYRLDVELAVPLPGFVKRRAESKIMTTALNELKRRCEADG